MDPLITRWLSAMLCFPQAGLLAHPHSLTATATSAATLNAPISHSPSLSLHSCWALPCKLSITSHFQTKDLLLFFPFLFKLNLFLSPTLTFYLSPSFALFFPFALERGINYQTLVFLLDCSYSPYYSFLLAARREPLTLIS